MQTYKGRKNSMRVESNSSGRMTFKIPPDGDKTTLVSLNEDQVSELRDQLQNHLDGNHGSVDKAALRTELEATLAKLPDTAAFADARENLQAAIDELG